MIEKWAIEKALGWIKNSSLWDREPEEEHYLSLASLLQEVSDSRDRDWAAIEAACTKILSLLDKL